jgi:REP element-mobilizing transposase RayT
MHSRRFTLRHGRWTRLAGYDYSGPRIYFVTLKTHRCRALFWLPDIGAGRLSPVGQIVEDEWLRTRDIRPYVDLDDFIIMPDHMHAVLTLCRDRLVLPASVPTTRIPAESVLRPRSLGAIIGGFKAACTTRINALRGSPGAPVWQDRYHDRVVRNQAELDRIRRYIQENPRRFLQGRS